MENNNKWKQEAYEYWLASLYRLRSSTRRQLLMYAGSVQDIYNMKEELIFQLQWLTDKEKNIWIQAKKLVPEMLYEIFCDRKGKFTWIDAADYPKRLQYLPDAPFGLFYYGTLPEDMIPTVGIVGARSCSPYGRACAEQYGSAFAEAGVTVVSGMASGIDSAAQLSALRSGGTSCAVLGCGIDICYPASAQELYWSLRECGCILSEYPIETPPIARHFPARNRILSGLSDKLLVVEARKKSGSLITADMALEQGKDIFAVPGRSADLLSQGCNELIHQGAGIALNPENLLKDMNLKKLQKINNCKKITNSLANDENLLYSWVDLSPRSLDEILEMSVFSEEKTIELLLELQLKGYIMETARNQYVRTGL